MKLPFFSALLAWRSWYPRLLWLVALFLLARLVLETGLGIGLNQKQYPVPAFSTSSTSPILTPYFDFIHTNTPAQAKPSFVDTITRLQISLIGVVKAGSRGRFALLRSDKDEVKPVKKGDLVYGVLKVIKVGYTSVQFEERGQEYVLNLPGLDGGISQAPGSINKRKAIRRSKGRSLGLGAIIDRAIKNPATIREYFNYQILRRGGGMRIRIDKLSQQAIDAGLQEGDVVYSVEGHTIGELFQGKVPLARLRSMPSLRLGIDRKGSKMELSMPL